MVEQREDERRQGEGCVPPAVLLMDAGLLGLRGGRPGPEPRYRVAATCRSSHTPLSPPVSLPYSQNRTTHNSVFALIVSCFKDFPCILELHSALYKQIKDYCQGYGNLPVRKNLLQCALFYPILVAALSIVDTVKMP